MAILMILAQAATTKPTTQPAPPWAQLIANPMSLFVLLAIVLVFFNLRGKRSQEKQKKDLLKLLKKNDRVQTIGGILGKVMDVEEARVLLKVDENSNTKIWFARNAIHRVVDEEKTEAK